MISTFQKYLTVQKGLLFVFLMLIVGTGCKNDNLIQPGDPINIAYKKALHFYRTEDYGKAAAAFETVISSGRGTDYGKSAHYFVAESYFGDKRYLLAADAYERFISLYPKSPKRQAVIYKDALCYYYLSPRYKIDQKYTRKAINKLRLFLSLYSDSEDADTAGKYLTKMRAKLAHKNYGAAELYLRLDQYKAAVVYFNLTVDQYPETSWAERALVKEIKTYVEYARKSIRQRKRERYEKAVSTYEKYLQLFPNGAHRQQAEAHVDDARKALADLGPAAKKDSDGSAG